jgi:hypothetical protein
MLPIPLKLGKLSMAITGQREHRTMIDRTARIRQLEKDRTGKNKTARTGLSEQDGLNSIGRKGQQGQETTREQRGQSSQDRAARTEQPGQDSQERAARTGQPGLGGWGITARI